jgi:hypothetical protein
MKMEDLYNFLTTLFVISGNRMHGLEIESDDEDDDGDGDVSNPAEVFRMYSLQHEVAVATHKTYILHMNASV